MYTGTEPGAHVLAPDKTINNCQFFRRGTSDIFQYFSIVLYCALNMLIGGFKEWFVLYQ